MLTPAKSGTGLPVAIPIISHISHFSAIFLSFGLELHNSFNLEIKTS